MRLSQIALMTILAVAAGCASTHSDSSAGLPAKLPPLSAETHFAAGQVDETQHNIPSAIDQYQQALQLNPKHLGAMYRLGVVYAQLKQYPQAIAAWQKYLDATNQSPTAYADLGFCQELAGQSGPAETSYRAAIAADPKCVPARVNYGLMLARSGKIPEAVDQWQAVLTPAEVHYNLGGVYETQGDKANARLEFNKALELDPKLNDAKLRVSSLDAN